MTHKVFNTSNVLGFIAFAAMILALAACEGEMYITMVVLLGIFAGCVYLAMKEDGQIK